ncbi:MAG: hypothetical protein IPP46_17845 [Bacteroidetes bacterium]|nr:hypothetical protein [Bacteroidota bacterium]
MTWAYLQVLTTTQTGNIVIPASATPGITGMRLVVTDDDFANNPCYSSSYGNVEDYLINIQPGPYVLILLQREVPLQRYTVL